MILQILNICEDFESLPGTSAFFFPPSQARCAAGHTAVIFDYNTGVQRLLQGHVNPITATCVSPEKKWTQPRNPRHFDGVEGELEGRRNSV